jgi:hypothetical protein
LNCFVTILVRLLSINVVYVVEFISKQVMWQPIGESPEVAYTNSSHKISFSHNERFARCRCIKMCTSSNVV